jgi:phospholipid transport system substrate-binding protein
MTLRPHGILMALVIACLTLRPAAAADAEAAERFISNLGDQTVMILQEPDLSLDEATAQFREIFASNFDIPTIGRFVLGRYWRSATAPQRQEFLELFQELIVETYARRFSEYSGQGFRVDNSRELSERDSMVSTVITNAQGASVASIDWRVRQRDGRQQIIDVVVEQISMGVTQRSDFNAVIQRGGGNIDVLLDALRDQIETAQNGT